MKPQPLLTRRLFRAILANRPYHTATCPRRTVNARRTVVPALQPSQSSQRRNLFGLSLGSTVKQLAGAKPTVKNIEAALIKLSDYVKAARDQSRPPSNKDLVDAFHFLTQTRAGQGKPLTKSEVYLTTEAFRYFIDQGLFLENDGTLSSTESKQRISGEDLLNTLTALVQPDGQEDNRTENIALAQLVIDQYRQHGYTSDSNETESALQTFLAVLATNGQAERAYRELNLVNIDVESRNDTWCRVVRGLYAEGRLKKFWDAIVDPCPRGILDNSVYESLVSYLAVRHDVEAAHRIFTMHQNDLKHGNTTIESQIQDSTLLQLLRSCVQTNQLKLGEEVAEVLQTLDRQDAIHDSPNLVVRGLLLWHAATGADVQQLEKLLMGYLERYTDSLDVDMIIFNELVAHAYSKADPARADSYIQLAQTLGVVPDAHTYALKLDYELSVSELDAARATFEGLTIQDVPAERVDVPVLNRYITKLASTRIDDLPLMTRVADRITETDADLSVGALAALTSVFLHKNEVHEITNLLRYRIENLPSKERASIAQVFKDFILDLNVKEQRAFNAYELLRAAFPETTPAERLEIMDSFFSRKKSDLACLVFGHMRQRDEIENRPNDAAYAQCFYGIASCRDVDGLQMIYNMLKMDIYVEQTTKIHNAMMAAYAACQTPFTAIIDHYWKILDSREGPTLSTFKLALRACETWIGAGGEEARRIMALMQKWDLIITKDVYHCYIGALAGQSQFENAIELVEHMQEDIGEAPDATTIGVLYNAVPWQYRKDEVEAWARKRYPDLWEELVSYGDEIDEEWEVRYFNVNRDIDVDDELLFGRGEYLPMLAEQARLGLPSPDDPDAHQS